VLLNCSHIFNFNDLQFANQVAQKFEAGDFFVVEVGFPELLMLSFRLSLVTATGIEDLEESEDPGDLLPID